MTTSTYSTLESSTSKKHQPRLEGNPVKIIPDYSRQGYAYHTTYQYAQCYNGNGYAKAVCVPGTPLLRSYQSNDVSHPTNYLNWSGYLKKR
jgi:hypothetical protein